MPKTGTTVETKVETYTEDGLRKKKTTTTTTTVAKTADGGYSTNTSTKTQIETLQDEDKASGTTGRTGAGDSDSGSAESKKNAMTKQEMEKFREGCMRQINDYRKNHKVKSLSKGSGIQKIAQKHAEKMLHDKSFSTLDGYGQSLLMKMPRPTGEEAADQWYNEKSDYDFKKAVFVRGAGNFTQLIWENSKEIGVGVASNSDGRTYVIALFDPPGNVEGKFRENVKNV